MGTLYDLLGALPSDDAEGLRTAFRKAAKATHPDINPDNPDAALRFHERDGREFAAPSWCLRPRLLHRGELDVRRPPRAR